MKIKNEKNILLSYCHPVQSVLVFMSVLVLFSCGAADENTIIDTTSSETFATKTGAGNTYYVSPGGADSNDGSIDSPWATIMHAVNKTGPGDTVMLRAGVQNPGGEIWIQGAKGKGGAPGQYWTLQAYSGEEAIIKNRIIIDASYVRIKGIHFVNGATIDVPNWSDKGSHVEIIDNLLTGNYTNYSGAINISGTDCLVEGNILEMGETGTQTHGIYIMAGKSSVGGFTNSNTVVRNNIIINPPQYGIHVYDEQKRSTDSLRHIENVTVENNFVANSGSRAGIIVAAGKKTEVQGVIIRNNVLVENADGGVVVKYGKIDDVRIYNNTIYGSTGVVVGPSENISNVKIKNNIITYNGTHIKVISPDVSIVADNNLYWPAPAVLENITDPDGITGDPLFVAPPLGSVELQNGVPNVDLRLGDGSAAIDTGLNLKEVPSDKDGVSRPRGAAYDIGAYEYH
ncbi:MAG TPA: hypothetical protein ENJ04_02585 [Nitrospirae bacterium]|nr:hypothetical protein [Nitrospirota bacterium]